MVEMEWKVARPYLPYLHRHLTPQRLEHSLGVMRVMAELAEIYPIDTQQAVVAGLLHDVAKDRSPAQLLALGEEAGLVFHAPCEQHPVYLHAPVGAYLAENTLQISEPAILKAIATHSYVGAGEDLNAMLAWCLRFADLLAPTHFWQGMHKLKRIVYRGHSEHAALLMCRWLIDYLRQEHIPVHPQLPRIYTILASRADVDETFFDKKT